MMNGRLRGDSFLKYVHVGLMGIGVVLLVEAIRRG